jgi:YHS domain-containing protein
MKRILSLLTALGLVIIVTHSLKNACVMASDQQGTESAHKSTKKTTEKDSVCGMTVKKDKALKLKHDGKNYYFCSQKCEDTFKKDPSKYTKKAKQ